MASAVESVTHVLNHFCYRCFEPAPSFELGLILLYRLSIKNRATIHPMQKIAIVGRPNVGKSALFNRLAGKKISIVHDQPGVTRDRLFAVCKLGEKPFEIIDTGGIGCKPDPDFSEQTRLAADVAIASADVLLLVVDGLAGRTPLDEELASILRTAAKPLLLVINKIDDRVHDNLEADFLRLGFRDPCPVSAAHGRGIDDLVERIESLLPEEEEVIEERQEKRPARIVIIGKPNVGKSSLTNAILGDERTIVSEIAGTTRDAVDIAYQFAGQDYVLCDTAGIRHRSKHNTSVEVFSVMRSEKALKGADLCLLLVDASQGVTTQEKRVAQLVQEAGKAVLIVLSKWDLAESKGSERETLEHHVAAVRAELFFLRYSMIVALSSKTGENMNRLFSAIEKMRQHATRRMGTGELNRHLTKCMEGYPPPMRGGRRLKILYATQVESSRQGPFAQPEVVLFVNEPKLLVPAYEEFLIRRIREKWEYPGLPIRLRLRGRKAADA